MSVWHGLHSCLILHALPTVMVYIITSVAYSAPARCLLLQLSKLKYYTSSPCSSSLVLLLANKNSVSKLHRETPHQMGGAKTRILHLIKVYMRGNQEKHKVSRKLASASKGELFTSYNKSEEKVMLTTHQIGPY